MAAKDIHYDDFLRSIQPVILGLTNCHVTLDRERLVQMRKGDGELRTLEADYRVDAVSDDHFDITADFTVAIRAVEEGGPEEKAFLSVQCSFYGHFHTKDNAREVDVHRFADSEARIFFVPYMRQFVTDMTARMSIPPVMIPLAIGTRISARPAAPSKIKIGKRAVKRKKLKA